MPEEAVAERQPLLNCRKLRYNSMNYAMMRRFAQKGDDYEYRVCI